MHTTQSAIQSLPLGRANNDEILVLVWILKIASAKIGATDSLVIF